MAFELSDDELNKLELPSTRAFRKGFNELNVLKLLNLVYLVNKNGQPKNILGTDPAAGSEISELVPPGKLWLVHGVTMQLITSATVAARRVIFVVDNEFLTRAPYTKQAGADQAASLTRDYELISGYPVVETAFEADRIRVIAPPNFLLLPGSRIRTSTTNLQAGDNFNAPNIWVEEMDVGARIP